MPLVDHTSFFRPVITTPIWRYMDLSKFVAFLTSRTLWHTNAEVLAIDDPHEGTLSTQQFSHRVWQIVADVPPYEIQRMIRHYSTNETLTPEAAFKAHMMQMEQICIYTQFWRRNYYVNCWHESDHESVAMWKVYGAPGPGIAIVSNGSRIERGLMHDDRKLYFGKVRYFDQSSETIDWSNAFNIIMAKRTSFSFENECRLVYWDTSSTHDPLDFDSWDDGTMRFEKVNRDDRPLTEGVAIECDLELLIDEVLVSPFAPNWYFDAIVKLKNSLGYKFSVRYSDLLKPPATAI